MDYHVELHISRYDEEENLIVIRHQLELSVVF
jgi:hypothetical protein